MNTKHKDPTRGEMLRFLLTQPCRSRDDMPDAIVAMYWFASEWHGGQSSNLYSVLSTSEFRPGPLAAREDEGCAVQDMICELEEEFAGVDYANPNPCGLDMQRGPVWMLWNGGSSYSVADQFDREQCEEFPTLQSALDEFESRAEDSYYPCVDRVPAERGGPSAWICFTDPFENGDLYPDAVAEFNLRGNAVLTAG